jgi:signal transduction histidine kinase
MPQQPGRSRAERERWAADRWAESGWGDRDWEPRFRIGGRPALWIPVIVSFLVQIPAALLSWHARRFESAFDDDPGRFALRLGLAVLGPVALLLARRFPGPVVAVVSAAAGAYVLVVSGSAAPPYIAVVFAVIGAVVRGARVWAWVSVGVAWAVTLPLGVLLGVSWQPALVVAVTLGLLLVLGVGEALRTRRERTDEFRRRVAERRQSAAQAERVRIARELHDVLAHSLSQINVQAGVGLHLIDTRPEEAAKSLAAIKATSKSALDEVRSVLGVLREGADATGGGTDATGGAVPDAAPLVPEPDLSRLPGLVASVRSQGLTVTFDDRMGDAAVPQAVQLALYRIVQESLTNVIRHAGASAASVTLACTDAECTAVIEDDGDDRGTSADGRAAAGLDSRGSPGSSAEGRGLLGMRERAALLGGHLEAGPRPGGGFRVAAALPRRTGGFG